MIHTINPSTEEILKSYPTLNETEINNRIQSASQWFSTWKLSSLDERATALIRIASILKKNLNAYARLITTEMGKPISSSQSEIEKCILVCHHYASHGNQYLQDQNTPNSQSHDYVCYRPLGTLLAVMPWNYPFWQVFRLAAPNLMAGNTLLLKHAPNCSGCSLAIETLFQEANCPDHLLQSLIIDTHHIENIIAHPSIVGVSLTGSRQAGRSVAALAGKHLKPCVLELGGSDPYLVLPDADLDLAADTLTRSRMNNSGQVCIAAKRIIIDHSVFHPLQDRIREKMGLYSLGDPLDPETTMGPLAREDLRDTVNQQVQTSINQGAVAVVGGYQPQQTGFYYPPTLLTNITPGMPAYHDEIFGPVVTLIQAQSETHAIDIANDTPFGLGAGVFSSNIKHANYLAKYKLQAGICAINQCVTSNPHLPFGGIKESGIGRELGIEGIRSFANTKSITCRPPQPEPLNKG